MFSCSKTLLLTSRSLAAYSAAALLCCTSALAQVTIDSRGTMDVYPGALDARVYVRDGTELKLVRTLGLMPPSMIGRQEVESSGRVEENIGYAREVAGYGASKSIRVEFARLGLFNAWRRAPAQENTPVRAHILEFEYRSLRPGTAIADLYRGDEQPPIDLLAAKYSAPTIDIPAGGELEIVGAPVNGRQLVVRLTRFEPPAPRR